MAGGGLDVKSGQDGYVWASSWQDAVMRTVEGTASISETGQTYTFGTDNAFLVQDHFSFTPAGGATQTIGRAITLEDLTYQPGNDNDSNDDYVPVSVNELSVKSLKISFTGNGLDGIATSDYYNDSNGNNQQDGNESLGTTPITAPEYDSSTGKNKYALEQVGTQFHVKADFELPGVDSSTASDVEAWATASDSTFNLGSESQPVLLQTSSSGSNVWSGTFQVAQAPQEIADSQVNWTWHVKIDGADVQTTSAQTILSCLGGTTPTAAGPTAAPASASTTTQPTTQQVDQTLAKWTTDAAAHQNGDQAILASLIKPDNLGKLGDYELPISYPSDNPFDGFSAEALLAYHKGSCGNWSDLFQKAAALEKVTVQTNGFSTRIYGNNLQNGWTAYQFATGFDTKPLTGVGTAQAKVYTFGDHEWCEYGPNHIVYDPSFGNVYDKADAGKDPWQSYIPNVIMGSKFYFYDPNKTPNITSNNWQRIGKGFDTTTAITAAQWSGAGAQPNYGFFTAGDRFLDENRQGNPFTDGGIVVTTNTPS